MCVDRLEAHEVAHLDLADRLSVDLVVLHVRREPLLDRGLDEGEGAIGVRLQVARRRRQWIRHDSAERVIHGVRRTAQGDAPDEPERVIRHHRGGVRRREDGEEAPVHHRRRDRFIDDRRTRGAERAEQPVREYPAVR